MYNTIKKHASHSPHYVIRDTQYVIRATIKKHASHSPHYVIRDTQYVIRATIKKQKRFFCFLILVLLIRFVLPNPLFQSPTSTLLEDRGGELLGARIASDGQWRFPGINNLDKLSPKFECALLCFEDSRFYQHHGIDGYSIGRAFVQNVKQGAIKQGASTISMQVVRLMRQNERQNKNRKQSRNFIQKAYDKLIESVLAVCLEFNYSKKNILLLYANNAPFGSNVVGIEAAAWRYFGRNAHDLSWGEAATLAVLPNAPGLIHPGRNRKRLEDKRNRLLDQLASAGYIDQETCMLAKLEQLPEKPLALPQLAPHLLDRMAVQQAGERITCSLSAGMQTAINNITQRHLAQFKANQVHNAAVLVAEVSTGKVLAYIGNAYQPDDQKNGSSVDVITAPRSTGSILKPFLYAAMLDQGQLLPNTLLLDIPLHIAGFSPTNYNKTFDGAVPAHQALERSLNVPAVRMLNDYNIERFHALLKDMGITTLHKPSSHYGLSLILGGAEGSLWELTGVYASMARVLNNFGGNSGVYRQADWHSLDYTISKPDQPSPQNNRVMANNILGAAAIYQTFTALAELNRPEEESSWKIFSSGRKLAWKTGTSYGNRDAWAIGVNPDYVIGVWVGNADGEGRPMLTGVGYAAPLLFDVVATLPTSQWFSCPYDEMSFQPICAKSGHKAGDLCETVDSMWIVDQGIHSSTCPYHHLIHLDATGQYQVNSDCYPPDKMTHRPWFVLPPAAAWYYQKKNMDYHVLPPTLPACQDQDGEAMQVIYPTPNLTIVITKQLNGEMGKVVAQAAHKRTDAQIFWYANDEYIGTTQGNHQLAFVPKIGVCNLYLTDDKGQVLRIRFKVE